ncbi:hypothetical protein NW755_013660 [Fusarium falciforme]|uniref:Uncharacterized protein n=1 Tax=Fusarium falciforme TaxID=195108 RepID=A0A9W8UV07_9HYPO|nr:hypothetical protein NW755_013660 [Fusarium falciforme]
MMCKDLMEIRHFISSLWTFLVEPDSEDDEEDQIEHDGDGMDPAAVAVVTNTAIEFATNIIEDMLPIFEEHGGASDICEQYMVRIVSLPGESVEEFRKRTSEPSTKDEQYEISNTCCYFVSTLLHKLAALPWNGNTPLYPEGHFGVYDPESDRESKSGEQKYREDTIVIGELFLEALALVHHVPDYPITDEFIRGVKKFSETNEISFSLIFAAQVTLDIHHAIRGYAGTLVETLVKRLTTMNYTLKAAINLHKDLRGPHWSSSNAKCLQETSDGIEWFLKDPMYEVKKIIAGGDSRARVFLEATEKNRLLRRSPILTGLALYHHRAEVREVGLALTNAWGSIILPAHLYNAVTEAGYSDCFWTDMEHLFILFGEEQFFVGGRPDNTADYVKRFMLQIGVSASVFTNRRRHSKKINLDDFSRGGTRFLKSRTPIHNSLRDRYQKNTNRMNWSPESIEEILSRSEMGVSARPKGKKPEAAKALHFSLPELLGCLGQAMEGEVQELSFPYALMHVHNWGLLRKMKSVFDPILRNSFGPTYMQHEWQLPFMIGHILALADGVDGGDESVLELAGSLLDEMEQEDSRTVDMAVKMMYLLCGPQYAVSPEQLAGMRLDWMPDLDDDGWEDLSESDED